MRDPTNVELHWYRNRDGFWSVRVCWSGVDEQGKTYGSQRVETAEKSLSAALLVVCDLIEAMVAPP